MTNDANRLNRAFWNERVAIHVGSRFFDVEGFKAGGNSLAPDEVRDLGDVRGRRLAHLQCHFGLDTRDADEFAARMSDVCGRISDEFYHMVSDGTEHQKGRDSRPCRRGCRACW